MPWFVILLLASVAIAPFDAMYLYNKACERRNRLRQREETRTEEEKGETDE